MARLTPRIRQRQIGAAWIVAGSINGIPTQALLASGPTGADRELLELMDYFRRRLEGIAARRAAAEVA